MLRYLTYGTLLLILVAAAAGLANAVDPSACNYNVARYSYTANDCYYISDYYNQRALNWIYSNQGQDLPSYLGKYASWTDSNGYYHAYDNAPKYGTYTYAGNSYTGYADYQTIYP